MQESRTAAAPNERQLTNALEAFDQGARVLETAYRELWVAHETERGAAQLLAAERIRDLCHELRNPLGGVAGLVSLLERELSRDGTERARRLVGQIAGGLASLESILRERTEADQDRADAGAIAEEITGLAMAENIANGGAVRFRVEAAHGIELPVAAGRFREILANLVRNAAEACGIRGTVTVRIESTLDALTLWVEDDGPGLPDVPDTRLFRRGFSTKGTGRGRGLAIVVEQVEEAGGSIHFGRETAGTRVRVRLPRRAA